MKRLVLITIIMTNCILLYAQSFCYNENYNYANLLEGLNESFINYTGPYHIRVYFHIIRQSDGTGEYVFPSAYIPVCMQILNNDYNSYNIFFDYTGLDYINNSNYYSISNLGSSYCNSLINTNAHTNAVDVYLLPTNGSLGGRASGIPGRALVIGGTMDNVIMGISHVLSHEMGHCLGLFHTFHGGRYESSGGCAELVNGSNCISCGDYVCDTPADPSPLFDYVNSECTWINYSYADSNGQLYHPDTKQIMAYVSPLCMEHFSIGQGERMRAHIATQSILQQRTTPTISYVQKQQFDSYGEEVITALDSVIAGREVMSGEIGDVVVKPNANVVFEAGKKIALKPGFRVNSGGRFSAKIASLAYPDNMRYRETKDNEYLLLSNNTSWINISYGFEPPVIATISKNAGDTIIREKKYRIIKRYGVKLDDIPSFPYVMGTKYLYEDTEEKKVYTYDPHEEKDILLYDFSLKIGDSFPGDSLYELTEISSLNNSGFVRNQFVFTNTLSDTIVWIEGIGNYTDVFYSSAIKHTDISRILCVHDNETLVYNSGTFRGITCDYIENIYEGQGFENTETISPNVIKILRDGQLFILRGEKVYTVTGQEAR